MMRASRCAKPLTAHAAAWLLATALLCAGLAASAQAPAAAPVEIPRVSVAAPRQSTVTQTFKLPGSLIPEERVSLYSKVDGYLDEITVDRGDAVKKDQVIAKLSAPEMEPQLALAKAKMRAVESQIGRASASAAFETANYQRLARLHTAEPGAVTVEDVEAAAAKDKMAKAEVVAMQAELGVAAAEVDRIKSMLDYLVVRVPFAGTITQRYADPGAYIAAGEGAKPIVDLMRVDKLRLAFDLPERLTPLIRTGARLTYAFSALPGKTYEGTIKRRTEILDTETLTMRAEVDIDNSAGLLAPGMYASVQLSLDGVTGISVVPSTALRTIDGSVSVLAVEGGMVKVLPVEALLDAGTEVVVSGELPPQTQLIVKGPTTLAAGQQVEIAEGS